MWRHSQCNSNYNVRLYAVPLITGLLNVSSFLTVAAGEVLHPTNVDSHQSHRGSRVYLLSESYPETFEPWLGSSRSYYSCNILISNSLMVKMTVNDLSYDDTTTEAPYCVMVEGFTTCAKKAHRPVTHFLNRDGQQGAAYHLSLLRNISGDFSARFWILLESGMFVPSRFITITALLCYNDVAILFWRNNGHYPLLICNS